MNRPTATRADLAVAWFTAVLTVVAIAALITTYFQWDAARQALAFSVESAKASGDDTKAALRISNRIAQAAEIQARSSNKSAAIAQGQLVASVAALRQQQTGEAQIIANPITDYSLNGHPTVVVLIQNVGPTSLHNMIFGSLMKYYSKDNVSKSWVLGKIKPESYNLLPPQTNKPLTMRTNAPLDKETLDSLIEGDTQLTVVAFVRYKDIAGVQHIRHFCSTYFGSPDRIVNIACPTPADS